MQTQTSSEFFSGHEISKLLSNLTGAAVAIRKELARGALQGSLHYTDAKNVQGEVQHELDKKADEIVLAALHNSGDVAAMVSEEQEQPVPVTNSGRYLVAIDPLDGSSNIGSNIPVGTIFSVWKRKQHLPAVANAEFLRPTRELFCSGYFVYGSELIFVVALGGESSSFIFDSEKQQFLLQNPALKAPAFGSVYSINEGNSLKMGEQVTRFLEQLKKGFAGRQYGLRYAGSLVADFDRNLRRGGVFLYPADSKNQRGKLRALYECQPLALIAQNAGALATDGEIDLMEYCPQEIHERVPLIIGSRDEVQLFLGAQSASSAKM